MVFLKFLRDAQLSLHWLLIIRIGSLQFLKFQQNQFCFKTSFSIYFSHWFEIKERKSSNFNSKENKISLVPIVAIKTTELCIK
jgi:hypothetical protein